MSQKKLGPYAIDRVLGRGGMGTVYAALDERTDTPAAVKILSAAFADDLHFRERFEAEIEALKMLRHPHIVQLYGYGEQDGQMFYAMEIVDGPSLYDELSAGRRFDWREVTVIGLEMCQALRHAHDRGVIHRDLKPANLLIDAQGHIKLSDFGIAKLFGGAKLTADGGVMGTADYMSPEQAEGNPATIRSDLYSLGSLLFALLAGRPPFAYKSLPEVIHALKYEDPPSLGRFIAELPEELEQIIRRLLHKDPQKRIATAQALGNRLQEILEIDAAISSKAAPEDDELEGELADRDLSVTAAAAVTCELPSENHSITSTPTVDAPLEADVDAASSADDQDENTLGEQSSVASPQDISRSTRFTPVTAETARSHLDVDGSPASGGSNLLKSLGLLLAVAALVAIVAFAAWPPSSDTLYARVAAAAGSGGPDRLRASEDDIRQFLSRFPNDPRRDEIAAYQEELEMLKLQESFQRRRRLSDAADSISLAQRAYLEAMQLAAVDPAAAADKLQALIDVFGGRSDVGDETRRCVELARRELPRMRARGEQFTAVQRVEIDRHLLRAEKLLATDEQTARAILRGIVQLYADKPWAAEAVQRANELSALPGDDTEIVETAP